MLMMKNILNNEELKNFFQLQIKNFDKKTNLKKIANEKKKIKTQN